MTPQQKAALESLAGRTLSEGEVAAIDLLLSPGNRNDVAIAAALSVKADGQPRTRVTSRHVTERGVRALEAVLPRSRFALLSTLKSAALATPAWLAPTLTALQIPVEDHEAYADDLASAHGWLLDADGLDIGANGARNMLDLIADAVPAAAPACAAVKKLAEVPDPVSVDAVSEALNTL